MKKEQDRNTVFIRRRRIRPILLLYFAFLSVPLSLNAQQIRVDADQEPLNQVLIGLAEAYGIQLSFDDRLLSEYPVTLNQSFSTPEEAIAYLLEPLPLDFQKSNEVYIIFSAKPESEPVTFRLSGRVTDLFTGESLPYTHLMINRKGLTTDFSGHFSATSNDLHSFQLKVSHLGYHILDTVLQAGHDHVVGLTPSLYQLQEVTVRGKGIERSGMVGEEAGAIRLNHQIAYRLPGNGDDALFNFLRLQPGIMAAGEQASEMLIWGGYAGHSQLLFDGFTIFGPRNFNDNISYVNPYMAKEIRVLKGGYPARYGDRVGGIVEVTGFEGNRSKPTLNLNINNMTVSGMAGMPVMKRAAVTAAFRHTYYNLYSAEDLGILSGRDQGNPTTGVDVTVTPDYRFRDANLKFAGATGKDDPYFISLYSGGDRFSYQLQEDKNVVTIDLNTREQSRQLGGTAFFGKTWKNGSRSNFSLSYSGLDRELSESRNIFHKRHNSTIATEQSNYTNSVNEILFRNIHHFNLRERHQLVAGVEYVRNAIVLLQNSAEIISDGLSETSRINLFVQDEFELLPSVTVKPGLRIDQPFHLKHPYIQPRFLFTVKLSDHWKFNGAWGIYRQFIAETSLLDDLGNYRYFWAICDEETIPVLKAQHAVGGILYQRDGFTLSIEPFFKTVQGITRLVEAEDRSREVFRGRGRQYGTDFLVKQYFGRHEGWVSYTLSRAVEYFPYFTTTDFVEAPQDQRHEIKGALLFDFRPFYLSVNYVYGSGLAYGTTLLSGTEERYPYSRLDAALIYRLNLTRVRMEAGISVLNVFNRENIKYANLLEVPDGQFSSLSVHAEAVPFTPTLYLNVAF